MTTIELKNILIHKISSINDEEFLKAINTIVNSRSETTTYKTSKEQKARIKEGIDQIEKGDFYTDKQVESEIKQWLKEK